MTGRTFDRVDLLDRGRLEDLRVHRVARINHFPR
jgi:hypothetical protein